MVSPYLPPATVVISSATDDHPTFHIATGTSSGHDQTGTSLDPDHIATGGVVDPNEIHIATGVTFDQNHIATGGSFQQNREEIPQVKYKIVLQWARNLFMPDTHNTQLIESLSQVDGVAILKTGSPSK